MCVCGSGIREHRPEVEPEIPGNAPKGKSGLDWKGSPGFLGSWSLGEAGKVAGLGEGEAGLALRVGW